MSKNHGIRRLPYDQRRAGVLSDDMEDFLAGDDTALADETRFENLRREMYLTVGFDLDGVKLNDAELSRLKFLKESMLARVC